MYQVEEDALWSCQNINFFSCTLIYEGCTKTMLFCTDYRSKYKYSTGTFLENLYDNLIPKGNTIKTEFIWSDGPSSEFKNKYMVHLLQSLSAKYNMKIENMELYSYITWEKCS